MIYGTQKLYFQVSSSGPYPKLNEFNMYHLILYL
jgi:hypothetical protein